MVRSVTCKGVSDAPVIHIGETLDPFDFATDTAKTNASNLSEEKLDGLG